MRYIIYSKVGKILRAVQCSPDLREQQIRKGEFIMEGVANDITQKIINGQVVDKTPGEIQKERPPVIPEDMKLANVTNGQWQKVLDRINILERNKE